MKLGRERFEIYQAGGPDQYDRASYRLVAEIDTDTGRVEVDVVERSYIKHTYVGWLEPTETRFLWWRWQHGDSIQQAVQKAMTDLQKRITRAELAKAEITAARETMKAMVDLERQLGAA